MLTERSPWPMFIWPMRGLAFAMPSMLTTPWAVSTMRSK